MPFEDVLTDLKARLHFKKESQKIKIKNRAFPTQNSHFLTQDDPISFLPFKNLHGDRRQNSRSCSAESCSFHGRGWPHWSSSPHRSRLQASQLKPPCPHGQPHLSTSSPPSPALTSLLTPPPYAASVKLLPVTSVRMLSTRHLQGPTDAEGGVGPAHRGAQPRAPGTSARPT